MLRWGFFFCVFAFSLLAAPPIAPTGIDASDGAHVGQIVVTWDHVQGGDTYRIFRSEQNDSATAESIGSTESLIFADLPGRNKTFYYWVRAEGANGISPLSAPDRGDSMERSGGTPVIGANLSPPFSIPAGNPTTGSRVYLGKTLFWDEQLSSTRTVACGTCHRFRSGGVDPRAAKDVARSRNPGPDKVFGSSDDVTGSMGVPLTSSDGAYLWDPFFGLREQVTFRRASTVLEAAFATVGALWDGKPGQQLIDPDTGAIIHDKDAALEAQALRPFLDPVEMGHQGRTIGDVVARLTQARPLALASTVPHPLARWIGNRSYTELFEEAFGPGGITPVRIAQAIASYERTLVADRTAPEIGSVPAALGRGFQKVADFANRCIVCHRLTGSQQGDFRVIGVRPPEEDRGRAGVTNTPSHEGAFRTPTMRNVGLRPALFHNGNASLAELVEFYNRGGDFKTSPGFNPNDIRPLNLTPQDKANVIAALRYAFTDPRVAEETGPIFDRPVLYTETARVPAIVGNGLLAANGTVPEIVAIEPPFAGNPRFTIALSGVAPGSQAVLVISDTDPGAAAAVPANGSFLRREVPVKDDGNGHGFTSTALTLPPTAGQTLFARWYVTTSGRVSVSRAARFTIFEAAAQTETFATVSAASLLKGIVARGSIVTGKGQNLAAEALSAPVGFAAELGGITLEITDRTGAKSTAPASFVSPAQINYLIPNTVAEGEATVRVLRNGTEVASGALHVVSVAPGIFTSNATGRDVGAALFQRNDAAGPGISSYPIHFESDLNLWVPTPLDLGPESSEAFLILFGTGLRNKEGQVVASIGGVPADVLYAGPQGIDGLDQVNLRIPRALIGRGEVEVVLQADGQRTNPVIVNIQ